MPKWFLVVPCLFFLPLATFFSCASLLEPKYDPTINGLGSKPIIPAVEVEPFYISSPSRASSKMSDIESNTTTSAVESATTVGKIKRKPSVKKDANGGKRWGPVDVSFHV